MQETENQVPINGAADMGAGGSDADEEADAVEEMNQLVHSNGQASSLGFVGQ